MTTNEEWRPVVGYEDAYEVSDLGRVRSVPRVVRGGPNRTWRAAGRVLSIYTGDHYSKVRLKRNGTGSTKNVHTLVAEAFLGPRPDGLEVCHGNGDPHDNRLANLRYDTHAANQQEMVAHGSHAYARRTHCNKGHEFTPENTLIRTGTAEAGRRCRACERERTQRRVAAGAFRKKAA